MFCSFIISCDSKVWNIGITHLFSAQTNERTSYAVVCFRAHDKDGPDVIFSTWHCLTLKSCISLMKRCPLEVSHLPNPPNVYLKKDNHHHFPSLCGHSHILKAADTPFQYLQLSPIIHVHFGLFDTTILYSKGIGISVVFAGPKGC